MNEIFYIISYYRESSNVKLVTERLSNQVMAEIIVRV